MLIFLVALSLGILTTEVEAQIKDYVAAYDVSEWTVESSRLGCRLTHAIPEYGQIEFYQEAGFNEGSLLNIWYGRGLIHKRAQMAFQPTVWQLELPEKSGWKFQINQPGSPITFSSRQSRQILDALDNGLQPTILHRDNTNYREEVVAKVSIVNFNLSYKKYLECQANLVPISFAEIQNADVVFDTGSTRLDRTAKQQLGYILAYLEEPGIRRIELGGYTDSIGSFRANHKLASARVEKVQEYLIASGISEKLLKLRVFGEQRPAAKNNTTHGRAQNRRVNVKIYR
jgi:sodium-type flagellar protein MotY